MCHERTQLPDYSGICEGNEENLIIDILWDFELFDEYFFLRSCSQIWLIPEDTRGVCIMRVIIGTKNGDGGNIKEAAVTLVEIFFGSM